MWEKKDTLADLPLASQRGYACVSLSNMLINAYRKNKGFKIVGDEKLLSELSVNPTVDSGEIARLVSFVTSDRKREMFKMWLDGYKHKEIAEVFGCPEVTVRVNMKISKKQIVERAKTAA